MEEKKFRVFDAALRLLMNCGVNGKPGDPFPSLDAAAKKRRGWILDAIAVAQPAAQ